MIAFYLIESLELNIVSTVWVPENMMFVFL